MRPFALLALVSLSAAAADRCPVSEFALRVPDGRAAWVSDGIQSMAEPTVRITTVHRRAATAAGTRTAQ
jgi:hypothetical protein